MDWTGYILDYVCIYTFMHVTKIMKKGQAFEREWGYVWEALQGGAGKEREKWCNYIMTSKI